MATSSISGLASGLDTAGIVNQLMQLEAIPRSRLQAKIGTEKSLITTLQALNAKAASLTTRAEALAKPTGWSPLATTSSNPHVSVTTTSTTQPTQLDLTVTSVARSHRATFADAAGLDDAVPTSVRLDRLDGTTTDLATDGTLRGLAAAINDPANATGLRASLVRVGDDSHRLVVESSTTGADTDFALTGSDGSALLGGATVRAGSDAALDLGQGLVVTSRTNTFTDLVDQMSVTLAPDTVAGESAAVAVTRDTAAMQGSVKELVDAVNAMLTDLDTQSRSSATGSGPLAGDAGARTLRSALLSSVYPGDGTSMASLGIQVTRDGTLVLDEETFAAAYAADPDKVSAAFTSAGGGFAQRVADVAGAASDKIDGTLSNAIKGRTSSISQLEDRVEDWDRRLELRRATLSRQFTALETALGAMSSQSNWLAGQIGSLPSYD